MADAFNELGLPGKNIIHIPIRMLATQEKTGPNEFRDTFIPTFVHGDGTLSTYMPVTRHFVLVDEDGKLSTDWEFDQFESHGRTWDGIMISDPCNYTISFGGDRRHVIMDDTCEQTGPQKKYTIRVINKKTGEQIVLDPGSGDDQRPGQGVGGGGG